MAPRYFLEGNRDMVKKESPALARLSENEQKRLLVFASNNGRHWKSKLRREWAGGSDLLRETRNVLGPRELDKVKTS